MRNFNRGDMVRYTGTDRSDKRFGRTGVIAEDKPRMITHVDSEAQRMFAVLFDGDGMPALCAENNLTLYNQPLFTNQGVDEKETLVEKEIKSTTPYPPEWDEESEAIRGEIVDAEIVSEISTTRTPVDTESTMPALKEHLSYTLPEVVFNKGIFLEFARQATEKYRGLVLTDDNVVEVKAIIAEANGTAKRLNEARINLEEMLSSPIRILKSDMDEVIGVFKSLVSELKEQVDNRASIEKKKKQETVEELLKDMVDAAGLEEEYKIAVAVRPEYLNKSYSMKKVKEDIKAQIAQQKEFMTQDKEKKQAIAARERDREIIFNTLKGVYPDVDLLLADLRDCPIEGFNAAFEKRRQDKLVESNKVSTVQSDSSSPDIHGYVLPVIDEEILDTPPVHSYSYSQAEVQAPIIEPTVVLLEISGSPEEAVLGVALRIINEAEALGLTITLK